MPIAPRIQIITQQLEEARARYRMGQIELKRLVELDLQVTALLDEARGTHFESALLCIHALVRSLETLASQKARAAELTQAHSSTTSERALTAA